MRLFPLSRVVTLSLAVLVATPALALDLPARKPGLWEMKMTAKGGLPPQTSQHCIDASIDKEMQAIGSLGAAVCSKQDVQHVGDTIVVDATCQIGPIAMAAHSVITGSFDSAYTIDVTSKRSGGPAIPGLSSDTHMVIEATWIGACKADQQPGDIIMANGMKMNVRDMQKLMQQIPNFEMQRKK